MSIPCDAYFAGFFDGGGCVAFYLRDTCAMPRLRFTIRAANLPILEMFRNRFSGTIITSRSNQTKKNLYTWDLGTLTDCRAFILAILPYAYEKKTQLELAFQWLEHRNTILMRGNRSVETLRIAASISEAISQQKRVDFNFPKVVAACG